MPNRGQLRMYSFCVFAVAAALFLAVVTATYAQTDNAPDYETLLRQFEQAEQGGDYEKALSVGKKMEEITFTRHVDLIYDMARLYCLTGQKSKAYEYLYWATDSGFWDRKRLMEDKAFESLKQDQLFKDLARKAWANGYLYMLERDQREEYQEKEKILENLGLEPDDFVADVGAGSGYFTIPIAKMLYRGGKVLATDIRQEMLDHIGRRVKIEQLDNVELLLAKPEDPMLPPGKVDVIMMVDVYHYIQERTAFGEKLREGLAPGGRLIVIDFVPKAWEERPWGPPPQQELSKETLTADLEKAGFKAIEEYDFLTEQFFVVYGAK